MIKLTKKVLVGIFYRMRDFGRLLTDKRIINGASYFPEYADRRKCKIKIFFDQLKNIIRYGDINDFYYLYGFDIKGLRDERSYVDYAQFRGRREELQHVKNNHQVAVLRDKFFFGIVANALNIRTPKAIAIIYKEMVFVMDTQESLPLCDFIRRYNIDSYIKVVDGECGIGVYQLQIKEGTILLNGNAISYHDFVSKLGTAKFLVQERIYQHEDMSKLFPNSTNSVRLTSVYDKDSDNIVILPSFVKLGMGNMTVDNWAIGGLIVGLDIETGLLREWAYYKPGYGKKTNIHPDTGIAFKGYQIPFFSETKALIKYAHSLFKDVHSIGWDITITPDGPCIIEGNDNWEISALQVTNHGMRSEYEKYM